jgi:4-hydroxy 2-oxovalerate aldolase
MSTKLQILDCTIRDGGYINGWDFSKSMVKDVYRQLSRAGIDFVEVGFRDADRKSPLWRRCPEEILTEIKGKGLAAKLAVMVDFGKAGADQFLQASESSIDLIRLAAHKNNIPEALKLLEAFKLKGYLTSIQLMGYPQYSEAEREEVRHRLAASQPDFVYVADSYGSLLPADVRCLIEPLVAAEKFKVGFHPHNNLQLAFANTIEAINSGADLVDSTLYGMGRGAGNLPTETLLAYLQRQDRDKYNVIHALFCVDMYMLPLRKKYEWGHQLPYMLSAMCQCHPTYAKEIVAAREYAVDELWKILNVVGKINPVGFDPKLLQKVMETITFNRHEAVTSSQKTAEISAAPPPRVGAPAYLNRHQGKPFLVLASGPNLGNYRKQIQQFIERYHPIVMGANYLGNLFIPDYHAFINLRRFIKYCDSVHPDSALLLSEHFPREMVAEHTSREYEEILFTDRVGGDFAIQDGVISKNCGTVSVLLIAVAAAMGAIEIFVAGMDGYQIVDNSDVQHFYGEEDETDSKNFLQTKERWNLQSLLEIEAFLSRKGIAGPTIITPSSYEKFYVGINNFI